MYSIPEPLWSQLAEGGRLLYPLGSADDVQELVLVTKAGGGRREERLLPVRFVPCGELGRGGAFRCVAATADAHGAGRALN